MSKPKISEVVIVGGGTAGWMAAAALSKTLGTRNYSITVVESSDIGTVGVGEATIPPIQNFNNLLGLDETEFVRATNATFKVGIEFNGWRSIGDSYFHPFGLYGFDMDGIQFSNYWMRFAQESGNFDFGKFNLETMAARDGRFIKSATDASPPKLNYAFHFDAGQYARFLRTFAEGLGVARIDSKITDVQQNALTGDITSLTLEDGRTLGGQIFVDCTGFRSLLIGRYEEAGFEDWSRFLSCNSAVAVPSENVGRSLRPYTSATAVGAGWQWRIPLQSRTGNGFVYCDDYLSADEAAAQLLSRLDGAPTRDPIFLRFKAGRRVKQWHKNVIAVGLSSGFLEPLESTSIHLIQTAITKLLGYFPSNEISQAVCDRFNDEMAMQYEATRDFLIAHYHLTDRDDTAFWKRNKEMGIPDSLRAKLEVFRHTSTVPDYSWELFKQSSWFAVLLGQGFFPIGYHPIADLISRDELKLRMSRIRTLIQDRVTAMPAHEEYIAKNCSAASA
jgi:tryptophan halogenase